MIYRMRVFRLPLGAASAAMLIAAGTRATAQQPAAEAAAIKLDAIPLGPESDLASLWFKRSDGVVVPQDLTDSNRNIVISDGQLRIELLAGKGSRQFAYVDGQKGPEYQQIFKLLTPSPTASQPCLVISPDEMRVAYVARKAGNQWVVVVDNVESPPYDKVLFIQFAPVGHRLVYVAQRCPKQFLVDDGMQGPLCDAVDLNQIRFSPDGARLAYVCGVHVTGPSPMTSPWFYRLMIDGKPSPPCEGFGLITFSADSKHLAFLANTELRHGPTRFPISQVVVDGVAGRKYCGGIFATVQHEFVDDRTYDRYRLAISADGKHIAYFAKKLPPNPFAPEVQQAIRDTVHFIAVIDGKESPDEYEQLSNLVMSFDGQRIVYVGTKKENGQFTAHLVENGQAGPGYDRISSILFSPDSKKLIYFATNLRKEVVVIDGQESESGFSFIFSKDGQHMAYLDRDEKSSSTANLVLDGKRFPVAHDGNVHGQRIEFLPDGKHVACYSGRPGGAEKPGWTIVGGDDAEKAPATQMVFSRDGKHVAEVLLGKSEAMQQRDASGRLQKFNWQHPPQLSIDGKAQEIDCVAIRKVCISDDGKHYACVIAGGGASRQRYSGTGNGNFGLQIDFDGRLGPPCPNIIDLALCPDGSHVAYVAELGGSATKAGNEWVVVDSVPGLEWQGLIPVHVPTWQLDECKFPEFLAFHSDGSLWFSGVQNGTLYRCRYKPAMLDQMPSFALTSTELLRPAEATSPYLAGEQRERSNRAQKEQTNRMYLERDRQQAEEYVASSRADIKNRVRQRQERYENPLGARELFIFNPDNSDRQGTNLTGLVAAGDALFGVNRDGGRNGVGVLFKLSLGGANYSAVHYFDRQAEGANPTSLIAGTDGMLYGTCSKPATQNTAVRRNAFEMRSVATPSDVAVFQYDPKTDKFDVLEKTLPSGSSNSPYSVPVYSGAYSGALQPRATICVVAQNRTIFGVCGQKPTQIFHLSADGKDLSILKNSKDWQAFVDGADGYFYGSNWDGLAKIKYDGTEQSMLHKFTGGDGDGDAAVGAPVLVNNVLVGYASASSLRNAPAGGTPRQGILYRINRDGSDYAIIDSAIGDPRHDGSLIVGDGDTVYGICPKGLFKVSAMSGQLTLIKPTSAANGIDPAALLRGRIGTELLLSSLWLGNNKILQVDSMYEAPPKVVRTPQRSTATIAPVETATPVSGPRRSSGPRTDEREPLDPWQMAAPGRIPTVALNIFKPLPLTVDPMHWSPEKR